MFVNHVTSFSQPDMECLLYYSVFNKKKKMTSYNKQHPPREATCGDGVLSKDVYGVYEAQNSSFKCVRFQRCPQSSLPEGSENEWFLTSQLNFEVTLYTPRMQLP